MGEAKTNTHTQKKTFAQIQKQSKFRTTDEWINM